ncbi:MAG: hypothetical protein V4524_03915 [Patescibacteria group bacterium]
MEIALDEIINPHYNPEFVVEKALTHIDKIKEKLEIPMTEFVSAASRLKRNRGISFLVTFEANGKKELVPLRVESTKMEIHTQFTDKEDTVSWRGRQIHSISIELGQTMGDLVRKITTYLKMSFNRFKRRLQSYAHHNKLKLEKRLTRFKEKTEPYRRPNFRQPCHPCHC